MQLACDIAEPVGPQSGLGTPNRSLAVQDNWRQSSKKRFDGKSLEPESGIGRKTHRYQPAPPTKRGGGGAIVDRS